MITEQRMLHSNISVQGESLCFAGYNTIHLAKKYGTPLMLLDENRIRENMRTYKRALARYFGEKSKPLYASKALSFTAMYQIASQEGIYTDIVSVGELYTAIKSGFDISGAFFHGNAKSDSDIEYAIKNGIGYFVVDTYDELYAIDKIARALGTRQKILFRVTPGIDPHTHSAISTGKVDSKFGTAIETGQALEITRKALELEGVDLRGFHCHIGSQIFEIEPYCNCADIMIAFVIEESIRQIAEHINSYCYENDLACPTILMEPGRSIVADAGMTIYSVLSVKEITGYKNYIAIDGGMTDNPRYALYGSAYTVLGANKMDKKADYVATIAGRNCESGDLIQENVTLPRMSRGDYLAVLVTGAYNYSMASNYNRVPRPAVVMLGDTDRLVIKRESIEDVSRLDVTL